MDNDYDSYRNGRPIGTEFGPCLCCDEGKLIIVNNKRSICGIAKRVVRITEECECNKCGKKIGFVIATLKDIKKRIMKLEAQGKVRLENGEVIWEDQNEDKEGN